MAEHRERGAHRVNPVTGKLEKMTVKEGMHRDGCLQLSDKYIHAARNAGLGAPGGMYTHIGSLKKNGAKDMHTGSSVSRVGSRTGASSSSKGGAKASGGSRIKMGVQGSVRTVANGRKATGGAPAVSFQRRKGVVNTIGGAKDTTRKTEARLPPKGARTGPRIMSFDTMPHASGEVVEANSDFVKKGSGGGGGAGVSVSSAGRDPPKRRAVKKASTVAPGGKAPGITRRLGGAGGGKPPTGGTAPAAGAKSKAPTAADRAKRAAYFDKLLAK